MQLLSSRHDCQRLSGHHTVMTTVNRTGLASRPILLSADAGPEAAKGRVSP